MAQRLKVLRAVWVGDLTALREMQDSYGIDWNLCVYDKTGDSALHVAARAGFPLLLKLAFFIILLVYILLKIKIKR